MEVISRSQERMEEPVPSKTKHDGKISCLLLMKEGVLADTVLLLRSRNARE